jgi:MoxR-like ATPase
VTGDPQAPTARLTAADVARIAEDVIAEVEHAVIGKRGAIVLVLIGVLAGGHVLLEDVPGLAKTLLVRSLARVLGLETSRIQFTPDLMPADVTGSGVFDQARGELVFRPGPVFANLVLGDEINRAPPKTQAALLEAMQERQVTVDGITHVLPSPFAVVATQNPIEYEGTYPLPEAQLDRFLLRLAVGYPDRDAEWDVIRRRAARGREDVDLAQVCDAETVLAMREVIERVEVTEPVGRYLVDLVRATRSLAGVEVGSSPRGGLALLLASRARAALAGREFVLPDDIKALAVSCLAHRLMLVPDLWLRGGRPEDLVGQCLDAVPVPVKSDEL